MWAFFRAADAAAADRGGAAPRRPLRASSPARRRPGRPRPGEPGSRVREQLLEAGALEPVHVEPRAAVFRIAPLAARDGLPGAARAIIPAARHAARPPGPASDPTRSSRSSARAAWASSSARATRSSSATSRSRSCRGTSPRTRTRSARFEREAKAVAALSHPNILAIHDFGREEGTVYAAMELLEGETLRQRLAGRGAADAQGGRDRARDRGRARRRARQGHRPPRPQARERVPARPGQVKVLDFGLARMDPVAPEGADVPTMSLSTEPGRVMGTVGYMAPEQVRGKAVDARADIFSFGAVLYEMLTGKRAFRGESPVETLNAILKEDPPSLFESTRNVSPALERIVRRCLEKRPEERFRTAHDLAHRARRDLDLVDAQPDRGGPGRRGRAARAAGRGRLLERARPGPRRRRPGRGRRCWPGRALHPRSRTAPPSSAG